MKTKIKKKKKSVKILKTPTKFSKLASITTNTLSNAYSRYKKNIEKKKIQEIQRFLILELEEVPANHQLDMLFHFL